MCIMDGEQYKPLYAYINGQKAQFTISCDGFDHDTKWDDIVYLGSGHII
jgi:hypothetical protein